MTDSEKLQMITDELKCLIQGQDRIEQRINNIEKSLTDVDRRIDLTTQRMGVLEERVSSIEKICEKMDERAVMAELRIRVMSDSRLTTIERDIAYIRHDTRDISEQYKTLLGLDIHPVTSRQQNFKDLVASHKQREQS